MYKKIFFKFFVKPLIFLVTGISIKGKENIPKDEPYIIIANHNSHLDILAIMSMYKSDAVIDVNPVAASDYFFKNKYLKWISLNLIGIIPINRKIKRKGTAHPLDEVYKKIEEKKTLIIFPEGSRGEPEELQKFKNGIGHIAKKYPNLKILPVVLENAGKALPKNEALFVPLIIKLEVKKAFTFNDLDLDTKDFVKKLEENFKKEENE
ncbi:1-acyl-sn-glycerol-3-phosphate acyltransferase [Arcobacter sp. LA11]|uniref:lysophospholipid acyltransferase family protein n=1 Tax=Arcobacter sp. LA11 TaxID=1898176 RepID=UPI0009337C0A|nr:lysophospholipid acyltransferase family protein [Arcobacter sp. LA11]